MLKKLPRADHGNALVELAVLLPMLLLIVCFLFDTAIWVQRALQTQAAVASAAAYGAIPGNSANHSGIVQIANFDATGNINGTTGFTANATDFYTCTPGGATVTQSTVCSGGAPYHYVKVTATATVNRIIGFPGIPSSLTTPAVAIYRVEVNP
jgi:Flp pilus assembly protein TadG